MHPMPRGEPRGDIDFRRHHAAVARGDQDVVERETGGDELVSERFVFHAPFSPMGERTSRAEHPSVDQPR